MKTMLKKVMRGKATALCRAITATLVLASGGVVGAPVRRDGADGTPARNCR